MNSDPNSDSEQCTESKLGRVHSAHTHGPGCAHAASVLRPGHAHNAMSQRTLASYPGKARPCHERVAARTGRVASRVVRARCHVVGRVSYGHAVVSITIQILYRNTGPYRAPCRARARPYRRPCHSTLLPCSSAISQPCCAILRCKRWPPATIQFFVSRLTPSQAMRARRLPLRAGRPCRGPWLAVLWGRVAGPPYRVVAPCCTPQRPMSRYNPLYRDSDWKMGSSPSSLVH